ncbi:NAD(P)H-binding protein [Nocardia sp. NPDC058705]|uniref:NAD(P)H-binding protein n=1 Tax=Nocardia sp. NPDC058705 TaxID=3346609 RepID=UPI0036A96C11
MTILVTGATGSVGRLVVDELLARGAKNVRALTVDPNRAELPEGVEVVTGYLGTPATLPAALDGVDTVYLAPMPAKVKDFAEAAEKAGVRRVVVLSGANADSEAMAPEEHWFYYACEHAIEAAGFEWTHLRPGVFMNNTLGWADALRSEGVVRAPYGQVVQTPIDLKDIAEVAAVTLLEGGHVGKKYILSGPDAITQVDQVKMIGAAIGKDVSWEELTPDEARELWSVQGMPADVAEFLLEGFENTMRNPQVPVTTVTDLTGRPGRTFAQWAEGNADKFA